MHALGRLRQAANTYKKAADIAATHELDLDRIHAVQGAASAYFDARMLDDCRQQMSLLQELAVDLERHEYVASAHHGLGLTLMILGDQKAANSELDKAVRIGRKHSIREWIIRGIVDRHRCWANDDFSERNVKPIRAAALKEERAGRNEVAVQLWCAIGHAHQANENFKDAVSAYERAWQLIKRFQNDPDSALECFRDRIAAYVRMGEYGACFTIMEDFQNAPQIRKRYDVLCDALTLCGATLTDCFREAKAIPYLRSAAKLARTNADPMRLQGALHDLAEALSRNDEFTEAIDVFDEAGRLAERFKDVRSSIMAAHNRAIAIQRNGDVKTARKEFTSCRNRSLRHKLWDEHVRAWEAHAILSAGEGRTRTAERQYRRAIAEAKKHDCDEMLPRLALNLAQVLQSTGKLAEAERLLHSQLKRAQKTPFIGRYYYQLAEVQHARDSHTDAMSSFATAKQCAFEIGDSEYACLAAGWLAEILMESGDCDSAIGELEFVLELESDANCRASLLHQLVCACLETGRDDAAQAAYDEAIELCEKHDLDEDHCDIQLTIFDYSWRDEENESRQQGLKAWANAALLALVNDRPDIGEIWAYVAEVVLSAKPESEELGELIDGLPHWLVETYPHVPEEFIEFIQGPLEFALELLPFSEDPTELRKHSNRLLRRLNRP